MVTSLIEERHKGIDIDKLNNMQKAFCEEMAADLTFNATEAAKKAGYKNPNQAAYKLLKNKSIQAYLGKVLHQRAKRRELAADDVLEHLRNALFLDPIDLFEHVGNGVFAVKDLSQIPEHVRRCITKIKCKVRETEEGTETYIELELMSKDAAMTNALKHLGLMEPDGSVNVNVAGQMLDFDKLCKPPSEEDVVEGKIQGKK